jgi:hypothetical protein
MESNEIGLWEDACMVEIKSASYEECRAEHFKKLMQKMQRKIDHWQYRGRYSLKDQSVLSRAYHECSEAGVQYNFYNDALAAFENQPKWISVDERLPEEKTAVLAFGQRYVFNGKKIETWPMTHVAYTIGEGEGWFSWDSEDVISVTHWMPLPQAPEVK